MVTRQTAMHPRPIIVWFRQDLRLADNPALVEALKVGPIIPLFVLDDVTPGIWKPGGASRWWLHHSLQSLAADLVARGSKLILRKGTAGAVIASVAAETNAQAVYWNRLYEPYAIARDAQIKAALAANSVSTHSFNASLLAEPWTVKTGSDSPYKVFTPFWRSLSSRYRNEPLLPAPRKMRAPSAWPQSDAIRAWQLLPTKPDWTKGFASRWRPGEHGAHQTMVNFLDLALDGYAANRDRPDMAGTSRLSPHLHWGEIGPRQIWHALATSMDRNDGVETHATKFLTEIGWREFAYHLLYHFPQMTERNLNPAFERFPWMDSEKRFKAWSSGRTGYPIVDAGMRELWATGYMHNRVRMITASFLIKHLLIPWQHGARWFWDTLLDADLANNSASWQWVAGSGADAAPFFRIFNPMIQGEKFDPDGRYVRKWVPELAGVDTKHIHRPWTASNFTSLGYHSPIVDHVHARSQALEAFKMCRNTASSPGAGGPIVPPPTFSYRVRER